MVKTHIDILKINKILLIILVILIGTFLRVYNISLKPLQYDEAVNIGLCHDVVKTGMYNYDPDKFHGPLFFYLEALLFKVNNDESAVTARLISIFFGIGSILCITLIAKTAANNVVSALVGLNYAISPGNVYFNRDNIHESIFCFFVLLTLLALCIATKNSKEIIDSSYNKIRALVTFTLILGLAGMICTKETYTISLVSLSIGFYATLQRVRKKDVLIALALALGISFLVYSSWGREFSFFEKLFSSIINWGRTAIGQGTEPSVQIRPLNYWFKLIGSYEWGGSLGIISCLWLIQSRDRIKKSIAIFCLIQFGIYSVIPYKTPWCVISILPPLILCYWYALDYINARFFKSRWWTLLLIGLIPLTHDGIKCYQLNYQKYDSKSERYAYTSTSRDIFRFLKVLSDNFSDGSNGAFILKYPLPLPKYVEPKFKINWIDCPEKYKEKYKEKDKLRFLVVEKSFLPKVENTISKESWTNLGSFCLREGGEELVLFKHNNN